MKKPLHESSYHHKGYWVKQELFGRGWKIRCVHKDKPGIYLEVVPVNSETLDCRRYVKELLNLLSRSDKPIPE